MLLLVVDEFNKQLCRSGAVTAFEVLTTKTSDCLEQVSLWQMRKRDIEKRGGTSNYICGDHDMKDLHWQYL
jgi:hypothetical protein